MDPSRFDSLVRTLTTGGSRRRLLGVLSALPLVGAALTAVPEDTSAAKGKGKARGQRKTRGSSHRTEQERQRAAPEATSCARRCRKKSSKQARRKCRKRCTPPTPECTTSQDCPAGELCESGVCVPIPDQCTVDTDCDDCEQCQSGICVAQCQPDQVCRTGQCERVACSTDRECGDCSRCVDGRCRWQCSVTEVCLSGAGGRCCQPRSCPAGADCGTVDDGCGGQARCGADTCPSPSNPCQDAVCTDNVCTSVHAPNGQACGQPGEVCQVGSCVCPSGVICPESGCCPASTDVCDANDQCCVPKADATTCAGTCGIITNNCGHPVDCTPFCTGCCTGSVCQAGTENLVCGSGGAACDPCFSPQTCGGGGIPKQCGCTPLTTCPGGANCGTVSDGCGGTVSCGGSCPSGQTCGGGNPGTPNQCGCTKKTCADYPGQCGTLSDGCNGTITCGCSALVTCCAGRCTNTRFDDDNCGSCGTACAGFEICRDSGCCVFLPGVRDTCSATTPCCPGTCRADGSCCLPSGFFCNGIGNTCCNGCGSDSRCL